LTIIIEEHSDAEGRLDNDAFTNIAIAITNIIEKNKKADLCASTCITLSVTIFSLYYYVIEY